MKFSHYSAKDKIVGKFNTITHVQPSVIRRHNFSQKIFAVVIRPLEQPRTQAQITKNRHTTVFVYRSVVAKLSERAGVLGEDFK